MTSSSETVASPPPVKVSASRWRRPSTWISLGSAAVLVGVLSWVGVSHRSQICDLIHSQDGPDMCPVSCTWPARITGATPAQAGVIRCYLRALAYGSTAEMREVVPASGMGGEATATAKAFRYARDARRGVATVTVRQNPVDSSSAFATIRFADGRRTMQPLQIANSMSTDAWRFWTVNGAEPNPKGEPQPAN